MRGSELGVMKNTMLLQAGHGRQQAWQAGIGEGHCRHVAGRQVWGHRLRACCRHRQAAAAGTAGQARMQPAMAK